MRFLFTVIKNTSLFPNSVSLEILKNASSAQSLGHKIHQNGRAQVEEGLGKKVHNCSCRTSLTPLPTGHTLIGSVGMQSVVTKSTGMIKVS